VGSVRVVVAAENRPPFEIEALAVEDDTYHVIGADPEFRVPTEHPIEIWTAVHETEPDPVGTVTIREGTPIRLLAVVHDLSCDPTCTDESVSTAVGEILRQAGRLRVASLGLPLLGAVHGRLSADRILEVLRPLLVDGAPATLERLWLVSPTGREKEIERMLDPDGK